LPFPHRQLEPARAEDAVITDAHRLHSLDVLCREAKRRAGGRSGRRAVKTGCAGWIERPDRARRELAQIPVEIRE